MQQVTILGHLGKDAVIRNTNGNNAIGFSVAVTEKYKNAQQQQVEETTWYNCTLWRKAEQGTKIADYLKKGQQVLIQGKPRARGYQAQDSKIYGEIEVRVDNIELVGAAKPTAGGPVIVQEDKQQLGGHRDAMRVAAPIAGDDDNDLPF